MGNLFWNSKREWEEPGKVYSKRLQRYVRLGSPESLRAIKDLDKNKEWFKRVSYLASKKSVFGQKVAKLIKDAKT
jgi:hypothetical protein